MNRRLALSFVGLLLVAGWSSACQSVPGATDVPAQAPDLRDTHGDISRPDGAEVDGRPDVEAIVGPVCTSGTRMACSEDLRRLQICNADGTGYDEQVCAAATGDSMCLSLPEPHCSACTPGRKTCRNDDIVQVCREDGSEYIDESDCDGVHTGRICQLGVCIRLCELAIKENTYMGCEYWGADLDNAFVQGGPEGYYDAQGAPYAIVVSNPDDKYPSTVNIYQWNAELGVEEPVLYDKDGHAFATTPLQPGELRVFYLPRRDVDGTVIAPLAYRIVSSTPITAYQFNPLENEQVFSNDASLLLPVNVLGKYYLVMTREQSFEQLRSYASIIAVQPGETTVTITVPAHTLPGTAVGRTGPDAEIGPLSPGDSITRTMRQYEVFNIETNRIGDDMTGTEVLATRNVVVFGGSEASNAPNTNHCHDNPLYLAGDDSVPARVCEWDGETACDDHEDCSAFITCCADHLEHQLIPVQSWGERYIATKSYDRNQEKDNWRIIAALDNTRVTTLPQQVLIPVLNRGEWFDFESREHFEIRSQGPIMVGQFLQSEQAPDPNVQGPQPGDAGIGDPTFILAVPYEQYRTDYVFLAPDKYELDYVNIIAPTGTEVFFDGSLLDLEQFDMVGTGEFSVVRMLIEDGVHAVNAEVPVEVVVYGYDQYVSYGYPAGMDIRKLRDLPEEE